ncbi:MAG: choice-of-anchor I family protein [Cycloclasticus pugetii]|jgi:hypothetical protein|uniref:choice-of-anchor I family protein n=1 Tax=Cycloclasticus TaxID=34067 RepID=UPI00257EC46B|nr:choice-of-anchor I family protein [Cycloclasticus sp.]MBV1897832.1 choice-of-anchor I family protein [Cycloclasticus sp.]
MDSLIKLTLGVSLTLGISFSTLSFADINIVKKGQYTEECGGEESCTEISAFSPVSNRIYTTNAEENELKILNVDSNGWLSEHSTLTLIGGGPNSVTTYGNWVAVAVEAVNKQDDGNVLIYDLEGNLQRIIKAGALPDMLTFTPNGQFLIVANEGEPDDEYKNDPEGTVTVINTNTWMPATADFNTFNSTKLKNVRIFGPGASVAQDLEPEYITVSADSSTAWISLQENNALAKLDIASATITDIYGLGYKKHQQNKNAFDASNKDNAINIQTWPTYGMYQPDAIASFEYKGSTFILSANEGDARDYDGYSEEVRVEDLILNPDAFENARELQQIENLGRLKTTTANGDINNDGAHEKIYSYGARSFSIWDEKGSRIYDSGSDFERFLATYADNNVDNEPWEEGRSDDKGPEPESITTGELSGKIYAFIGLERANGIFIYDISNPRKPKPTGYINIEKQGDIGPEGLIFIKKTESHGWLIVTNEISNTISIYEISID